MPRLFFRNDLIATGLFFIFSLYFYLSNIDVGQYSMNKSRKLAKSASAEHIDDSEQHALNPELHEESLKAWDREMVDSPYHKNLTNLGPDKPRMVVLLASLPRSGSTMISELLRTRDNTVLFFEPDHRTEFMTCATVPTCMSDYFRSILSCTFNDEFEIWQRKKFFNYFHQRVKDCQTNECKMSINMRVMCREADFSIAKIIRVPLGFFEAMLSDESIDAKIIHLVRDPRASLISNKKMGWVADPLLKCSKVHEDMLAYDYFHEHFPHKVMQVKYEEFCLNPLQMTQSMFHFAYGDQTLSQAIIDHVKLHTEVADRGAMNTVRKSDEHFQEWRWEIRETLFQGIEGEKMCVKCIEKLNYRVFKTMKNVLDKDLSLFLDKKT